MVDEFKGGDVEQTEAGSAQHERSGDDRARRIDERKRERCDDDQAAGDGADREPRLTPVDPERVMPRVSQPALAAGGIAPSAATP
jgi:hypothetical protein